MQGWMEPDCDQLRKKRLTILGPSPFAVILAALIVMLSACARPAHKSLTIGVAFESLQAEYWVAAFDAFEFELKSRNFSMKEAIADGDANRQYEQIQNFIAQGLDGIIVAPKDAQTVIPMIRAANEAGIPIVLYNRLPGKSTRSVAVVADNYGLAMATVDYLAQQARKLRRKHKAMILMGDLSDLNGIRRRDGFEDAVKKYGDLIEVVARVPKFEWNQEKGLAGAVNAFQAHPDIDFIFSSSDFLFPSLVSALKGVGKRA